MTQKLNNYVILKRLREDESLLPNEKLIAMILLTFRNTKTGQCSPGQRRLAKNSGYSQPTVSRIITNLISKGIIENKHHEKQKPLYVFYPQLIHPDESDLIRLDESLTTEEQHAGALPCNPLDLVFDPTEQYHQKLNENHEHLLHEELRKEGYLQ